MTHLSLTRTNGHPLAGRFYDTAASAQEAWDWVARTVARQFDCLPDDVDYDDGGVVTVNGEAVALCRFGLTIH